MFDVFGKLNPESRMALFAAVWEAYREAASELTPELIAAGLLRSPSMAGLCGRLGVEETDLMKALGLSSAAGSAFSPFDTPPQGWQDGMFLSVAMSARVQAAMKALAERADGEALEPWKPAQVLRWLLDTDQTLRSTCGRVGLTSAGIQALS